MKPKGYLTPEELELAEQEAEENQRRYEEEERMQALLTEHWEEFLPWLKENKPEIYAEMQTSLKGAIKPTS